MGRDQRLYAAAFVMALVIETYGTWLGGWRYYPVEPWFGLTTTNPPVMVGAIYCTLEVLVRLAGSSIPVPSQAGEYERALRVGSLGSPQGRGPSDDY